jgi:hypothetical protein
VFLWCRGVEPWRFCYHSVSEDGHNGCKIESGISRSPAFSSFNLWLPEAIVQAVSRRLPIAAARIRAEVRSCGICGGQSYTAVGLLRVFGFLYQFSFHRLLHIHHLSPGAGTTGQIMTDVPSGLGHLEAVCTPTLRAVLFLVSRRID